MKAKFTALLAATLLLGTGITTPARANPGDSLLGVIIGGTMGGLLGSTLGKGNGRVAATAAGAVIGGTLGHAITTTGNRIPAPVRRRIIMADDQEKEVIYRPTVRQVYVVRPVENAVIIRNSHSRHLHERRVVWKNKGRATKVCSPAERNCRWVM